jgi:hypothetical protein
MTILGKLAFRQEACQCLAVDFPTAFFLRSSIMAKVSGPLMSMGASGSFGGALVFGLRKGQNVVRQLVTPANPKSADQAAARNIVRVTGAAQRFANLCVDMGAGRLVTDKAALIAATPSGQTWNSYLVFCMTGVNAATYAAAVALWGTLAANHAAWETAAAGLTPAFPDVAQKGALDAAAPAITHGEVFFLYTYGLYIAGISAVPGAVPPVYA